MDNNIFEMAYANLYAVCDLINCRDIEDKEEELLNFLSRPSKEYDNLITTYDAIKTSYDIAAIKRIMMLIVVSRAYIKCLYNIEYDIDKSDSEEIMLEIEEYDSKEIIDLFLDKDPFIISLIPYFMDNFYGLYIEACLSKELVFKYGKLYNILVINPFEVLDIYDYIPKNMFTRTEMILQKLFDYYNIALNNSFDEDNILETQKKFLESIANKTGLLHYLIANVYEILVTSDVMKEQKIKEYIESNDISVIVKRLYEDEVFANRIIDVFIGYNDCLMDQDLLFRRDLFKNKSGNIMVLKRLNPYFKEEEIVYENIRKTKKED